MYRMQESINIKHPVNIFTTQTKVVKRTQIKAVKMGMSMIKINQIERDSDLEHLYFKLEDQLAYLSHHFNHVHLPELAPPHSRSQMHQLEALNLVNPNLELRWILHKNIFPLIQFHTQVNYRLHNPPKFKLICATKSLDLHPTTPKIT